MEQSNSVIIKMQKILHLALATSFVVLAQSDNAERAVSRKQVLTDIVHVSGDVDRRRLQTDVLCTSKPHGEAVSCVETTTTNDTIKFSVDCPAGTMTVDECLQDQKRICYQFNNLPCIGSFFCGATNFFSLDCGNLFARSNGNDCSKTDCNVNCVELRDTLADYNSVELDNSCFRLGEASTTTNGIVTTRWTHVLSDSTEIQVTGTREMLADKFEMCVVNIAGISGSRCPCRVNCPPDTMAISYDCTDFTTDACAAIDCEGNCLPGGFPPPPTAPVVAPVTPPIVSPVTPPATVPVVPPVTAPVTPPLAVPVSPPVTAPVQPPLTAPVAPPVVAPVTPPVTVPRTAPVSPPVAAPVSAPVAAPIQAPLAAPVSPPLSSPIVVPPVSIPVTPPMLPPVMITTSPPVVRPIAGPTNNSTICPLWWGLY